MQTRLMNGDDDLVPWVMLAMNRRGGQGVGRVLMTELIALADSCRVPALSLSVEDNNVIARRIYESFGFGKAGRTGDSDTLLLMLD